MAVIGSRLRRRAPPEPSATVLVHLDGGDADCRMEALAARLAAAHPPLRLVVTGTVGDDPVPLGPRRALVQFVDRLRPRLALFCHHARPEPLVALLRRRQVPMILVNARAPLPVIAPRPLVLPGLARFSHAPRLAALEAMSAILPADAASAAALARLDLGGVRLAPPGLLVPVPPVPRCNEAEREDFADLLQGRPVWLAVHPHPAEIGPILAAHRHALRGAHRLLLILVPQTEESGQHLAQELEAAGWAVARRGAEQPPDERTEVYLADSSDELGLWYRLAPITFLGGSLADAGPVVSPLGAGALGSAILTGPAEGEEGALLRRLVAQGGLRRVQEAAMLGPAVADLLSPDRSAGLACAAWEVLTEGAEVEDRLMELIAELLPQGAG